MKGEKHRKSAEKSADRHGGSHMRLADPESRLDCLPISEVKLNLECRDEIIPILRALQHLYADASLRRELLALVGKDVNQGTSRKRGRRGLNYWEIIVLAAARLGCNLDYDKLQDLAENHRSLRHIMGIGDWQDEVDFDWRRIEDNLNKLRPETLRKINDLVVKAGHVLEPQAIESVRGAAFALDRVKDGTAPLTTPEAELLGFIVLTEKVCDNARRRVLEGETLANEEKIHSIFEPHTELIKRGKHPNPIEFGHKVLVIEDAAGFVVDYRVLEDGVLDQDVVVPVMKKLQKRMDGKIKSASFDRAFHTPRNQEDLAQIVRTPCIAAKGPEKGQQQQREGTVAFR